MKTNKQKKMPHLESKIEFQGETDNSIHIFTEG